MGKVRRILALPFHADSLTTSDLCRSSIPTVSELCHLREEVILSITQRAKDTVTSRYVQWGMHVPAGIACEYLLLMFQKGEKKGTKVGVWVQHQKWKCTHVECGSTEEQLYAY